MDAHVIQPDEYDEIPELTDEMLAHAVRGDGAEIVRRQGRPAGPVQKVLTSIRLDRTVLDAFKASGPGWQTRINDVLSREVRRMRRKG